MEKKVVRKSKSRKSSKEKSKKSSKEKKEPTKSSFKLGTVGNSKTHKGIT